MLCVRDRGTVDLCPAVRLRELQPPREPSALRRQRLFPPPVLRPPLAACAAVDARGSFLPETPVPPPPAPTLATPAATGWADDDGFDAAKSAKSGIMDERYRSEVRQQEREARRHPLAPPFVSALCCLTSRCQTAFQRIFSPSPLSNSYFLPPPPPPVFSRAPARQAAVKARTERLRDNASKGLPPFTPEEQAEIEAAIQFTLEAVAVAKLEVPYIAQQRRDYVAPLLRGRAEEVYLHGHDLRRPLRRYDLLYAVLEWDRRYVALSRRRAALREALYSAAADETAPESVKEAAAEGLDALDEGAVSPEEGGASSVPPRCTREQLEDVELRFRCGGGEQDPQELNLALAPTPFGAICPDTRPDVAPLTLSTLAGRGQVRVPPGPSRSEDGRRGSPSPGPARRATGKRTSHPTLPTSTLPV